MPLGRHGSRRSRAAFGNQADDVRDHQGRAARCSQTFDELDLCVDRQISVFDRGQDSSGLGRRNGVGPTGHDQGELISSHAPLVSRRAV